jgi:hypothetical protein
MLNTDRLAEPAKGNKAAFAAAITSASHQHHNESVTIKPIPLPESKIIFRPVNQMNIPKKIQISMHSKS